LAGAKRAVGTGEAKRRPISWIVVAIWRRSGFGPPRPCRARLLPS